METARVNLGGNRGSREQPGVEVVDLAGIKDTDTNHVEVVEVDRFSLPWGT